jgi:hypothetical protein
MTQDVQKNSKLFFFLHIPKTAGSFLTTILENNFAANSIYEKIFYYHIFEQEVDFSKFRLIHGHFGYWLLKILPKNPAVITILREPHELFLSHYDVQLRGFEEGLFSRFISAVSIDEVFDNPELLESFSNNQTRYMVADLDVDTLRKYFRTNILTVDMFEKDVDWYKNRRKYAPKILIKNDDEVITIAKKRLEKFAFVGIFEKLEDTLLLLYYTFGWFPLKSMSKINILPRKTHLENLSQDTRQKISQAMEMDVELYEYGVKLFNERFSEMITSLKEKYYEERYQNLPFKEMIYDMLEKHYFFINYGKEIPFHSEINFSFDQAMIGIGWHKREVIGKNIFFRWTGPVNTSTIYFLLNKNDDLKIRITILFTITQDVLDSLVLEVNDAVLKLDSISNSDKIILEGIIPKSTLQKNEKNMTKLAFKVNQTTSPATINPQSDDTRLLGIAFERIEIKKNISQ